MRGLVDFIHVGDYKTGTTWLQKAVFPFHPDIQYLGDPFQSPAQQEVLRELVDIRDLDFDANKLYSKFKKNFVRDNKKIVGISREALSQSDYITGENARRNAERIRLVFGEVKIFYTIRAQQTMLSSIYSQYLKCGGTRGFNDWFLDPIECKGVIERLKYDKNIEMYHEIFGVENVIVLLFEELVADKNNFLKKLFLFLGCSDAQFIPIESENKVNTGLTIYGAFVSKILHRLFRNVYHKKISTSFWIDKIIYRAATTSMLNRRDRLTSEVVIPSYGDLDRKQRVLFSINMGLFNKITKLCEKISIGRKVKAPKEVVDKIMPLFVESNRRLKEKHGLNVDKHGWSI